MDYFLASTVVNALSGITSVHLSVAHVECSPYVYSYQTLDELKEAEQSRRDILNLLLKR